MSEIGQKRTLALRRLLSSDEHGQGGRSALFELCSAEIVSADRVRADTRERQGARSRSRGIENGSAFLAGAATTDDDDTRRFD